LDACLLILEAICGKKKPRACRQGMREVFEQRVTYRKKMLVPTVTPGHHKTHESQGVSELRAGGNYRIVAVLV